VAVDSGNLVRGAGALFLDAWKQAQRLERTMQEIVPGVPFQSVLCDPAIYNGFRSETAPAGSISEHEGSVRLLPDGECYTALLQTIRGVRQSLRISMFFFSNPTNKKHPNYDLIGELLWAHGRGVDIRIVLDANRETDIYHSRRINTWVKDQPNRNTRGSACGSVRSSRSTTRSSWSPTGTRP